MLLNIFRKIIFLGIFFPIFLLFSKTEPEKMSSKSEKTKVFVEKYPVPET